MINWKNFLNEEMNGEITDPYNNYELFSLVMICKELKQKDWWDYLNYWGELNGQKIELSALKYLFKNFKDEFNEFKEINEKFKNEIKKCNALIESFKNELNIICEKLLIKKT